MWILKQIIINYQKYIKQNKSKIIYKKIHFNMIILVEDLLDMIKKKII